MTDILSSAKSRKKRINDYLTEIFFNLLKNEKVEQDYTRKTFAEISFIRILVKHEKYVGEVSSENNFGETSSANNFS